MGLKRNLRPFIRGMKHRFGRLNDRDMRYPSERHSLWTMNLCEA